MLVTPYGSVVPAPPADHAGGDGYVLKVGDLGSGGGGFDWAFSNAAAVQTDCKVSAWVYIDWANMDATPTERDYFLTLRQQTNRDPQTAPARQGYIMMITGYSSWDGGLLVPPNFKPFICKRVGTTAPSYTVLGSYGTNDVTTGWHFIEFQAVGTDLSLKIDSVTVCSASDSQYASGYSSIGYYDDNGSPNFNSAAFDNVVYETATAAVADWSVY